VSPAVRYVQYVLVSVFTNGFVRAEKSADDAKTQVKVIASIRRTRRGQQSEQMTICHVLCILCCANAEQRGHMDASRAAEAPGSGSAPEKIFGLHRGSDHLQSDRRLSQYAKKSQHYLETS
jgi:hypothetical protein